MQILPGIIKIEKGKGRWSDSNGSYSDAPLVTLALAARLVMDLRGPQPTSPDQAELAPYPFAEFADCVLFYIAVDSDLDQNTLPVIHRSTGISVQQIDGYTIIQADLPELDTPALRNVVKTQEEIILKGEIGGLNADGQSVFVVKFPLILGNRVYIPDGSGSPTPDPEDPAYLPTEQALAYINDQISLAMAALELPEGEVGPPPTLTLGTVTEGVTASATLVPVVGSLGAYTLNLVLPSADDGVTPDPITPLLTIGTISAGAEAAAVLTPVVGTPGAYTLNLTLPRGADGSGVTPSGPWAADVTYALNAAVRHASAWWRSLHDDNVGNAPPATRIDNEHWEVIVRDGLSADPLVVNYNSTDDPDDLDWHLYRRSTDRYYRFTTDGGLTFTEAMELSQAPLNVMILFNPDTVTDWANLPAPVGTNNYHAATGKYYRVKTTSSIWGPAQPVHALAATEAFRVQFGATPETGEPSWHALPLPGDDRILFYNLTGTIRLDVSVTLPDGEEIAGLQLCAIADPWHATYTASDAYQKISVDSGVTYTAAIPLFGKSAYQTWRDLGNQGTEQDFLNSLVSSGGGIADAPVDGKIYGRKDAAWVELTAIPGGDPDPPAETMFFGYVPYEVAGSTTSVTQITMTMLSNPNSSVQSGPAEILGKTAVGLPPAGSWLVVLLPAAAGLTGKKFDGLSGPADFAEDNGAPGTGANGSSVSLDGDAYLVYGEFRLTASDAHIYVNEVQS